MKRRIIITEEQEAALIAALLQEAESDQNLVVFDFLDKNFVRADFTQEVDGQPTSVNSVVWLDAKKQPYKTITLKRLFDILQDKFQSLTSDKTERDNRLKEIINAWINKSYNIKTGNILT